MRALRLILHEAWHEFLCGIRSGIVTLTFVGLVGYLLLVLTSADNIQKLGATDVPRDAAILIYLMATGCMFFQFFAWAWVYAQPVLRDRRALLHELVLSSPNSLTALLWGRFLGAVLVGGLLSSATLLGFVLSPVLGWLHLVPTGAVAPIPWHVLLFAFLWLMFPVSAGIGALYYLATLKTRNIAGAFGVAALLVLLWMIAIIVLSGGYIRPGLATVLDPSLFTFAKSLADTWTPAQKSTALLPLTLPVLLNRLLWCALPLLLLGFVLRRIRRESLVLDTSSAGESRHATEAAGSLENRQIVLPRPARAPVWAKALWFEIIWQLRLAFAKRALWIAAVGLAIMGVLSAFVHVVWHAEGPMIPRPDMLLPLLTNLLFLVIAFLVAALAGYLSRRDDVPGFGDILDASPAPAYLRLLARALTVLIVALVFALVPGVAGIVVTALAAPRSLSLGLDFGYELLVLAPALMEIAAIVLFVHALIRRAGVAYAASMFVTFCLIVDHEVELVTYPLYEVGIPGVVSLSGLTGWAPWRSYLLALDGYKLALCLLLIALAAMVLPRGLDSRFGGRVGRWRERWFGLPGVLGICSLLMIISLGSLLRQNLIVRGAYRTGDASRRRDADWEKRWLASAGVFSVEGGTLILQADPSSSRVGGSWQLRQVRSSNGYIDAELPDGFVLRRALVASHPVKTDLGDGHLRLALGGCAQTQAGCDVRIEWDVRPTRWSADGTLPWMLRGGLWLQAIDAVPRLGLDPQRLLRAPSMRARYGLDKTFSLPAAGAATASDAVAPAGDWHWKVTVGADGSLKREAGATRGPLSFAAVWAPHAVETNVNGLRIISDRSRVQTGREIAEDVQAMRACVARRLGGAVSVREVAQWPRGLGETALSGGLLQLGEEPNWDVARAGVGRWLRQARIATALARRSLIDTTDLRDGQGAAWVRNGIAGSVGLLCVGDVDGVAALDHVMARYADATTRGLAASAAPVESLALARDEGWSESYAPLATLLWMNEQQPGAFAHLLDEIRKGQNILEVLPVQLGQPIASELLGPPQSSSFTVKCEAGRLLIHCDRWRWRDGRWQAAPSSLQPRVLEEQDGRLEENPLPACGCSAGDHNTAGRLIDAWPSYDRSSSGTFLAGLCAHS